MDKDKLKAKRDKEAEESVNLWQSFLGSEDKDKKDEKDKGKK